MFQQGVTPSEVNGAKHHLGKMHEDISEAIRKKQEISELNELVYEFRKYIIHCILEGKKTIYAVDGFDGSGKTTSTTRLSSPKNVYDGNIVHRESLGIPTQEEKALAILELYRRVFPGKGRTLFLDRSWNNRAFVQHLYGYCTPEQYEEFIEGLAEDLVRLEEEGYDITSFFLNISPQEQQVRLEKRKESIMHGFRYSSSDAKAHEMYDRICDQHQVVSGKYQEAGTPFITVDGSDKKEAIKQMLKAILHDKDYPKRSKLLDLTPNSRLVLPRTKLLKVSEINDKVLRIVGG